MVGTGHRGGALVPRDRLMIYRLVVQDIAEAPPIDVLPTSLADVEVAGLVVDIWTAIRQRVQALSLSPPGFVVSHQLLHPHPCPESSLVRK